MTTNDQLELIKNICISNFLGLQEIKRKLGVQVVDNTTATAEDDLDYLKDCIQVVKEITEDGK